MSKIELAIKFGSNEIIVYRKGMGIVERQSSYVAIAKGKSNGRVYAYGDEARRLCSVKSAQYELCEPIQGIDIVNQQLAKKLISNIIDKSITEQGIISAIVAVPCALTEKKLLELKVLLHSAGIGKITFVQNGVCVRYNLPDVQETDEVMVVDMGKFLVDISVLTKYDFIMGRDYLIGGAEMDTALATYIQDNYNATITEDVAEAVKNEVASMHKNDMYTTTFQGLREGAEYGDVTIRANEARVAIIGVYEKIFDLIEEVLDSLPDETMAQIRKNGIVFTGGVSSICGLLEYATKRLNLPAKVMDNPKDAVILGAGKLLSLNKEDFPYIKL